MSDKDCQKTIDILVDNIEPDAFAAEHLKTCKACRDTRTSIEQMRLSSSPVAVLLPSAAFMSKFKARLEPQIIEPAAPAASMITTGVLLAVALAVSIILGAAYFVGHQNDADMSMVSQPLPTIPAHTDIHESVGTESLIDIPDQPTTVIFYPSPLQKPE